MKKIVFLIIAATALLASCNKDAEQTNSGIGNESNPFYYQFPHFETHEKYIGCTCADTASIIAELKDLGYSVSVEIDHSVHTITIKAKKQIESHNGELVLSMTAKKKIYWVYFNYHHFNDIEANELKESYIHMLNNALNTVKNNHFSSFYGTYYPVGSEEYISVYDMSNYLELLPTLPAEVFVKGVSAVACYGYNSSNNDFRVNIENNDIYISYGYKDSTIPW